MLLLHAFFALVYFYNVFSYSANSRKCVINSVFSVQCSAAVSGTGAQIDGEINRKGNSGYRWAKYTSSGCYLPIVYVYRCGGAKSYENWLPV